MANENSLDSWIDRERLRKLIGEVRPDSLNRPSAPLDSDLTLHGEWTAGPPGEFETPAEQLLPNEIPQRAFTKGARVREPEPIDEGKEAAASPPAAADAEDRNNAYAAPSPPPIENAEPEEAVAVTKAPEPTTSAAPLVTAPKEINPLNLYFHSPAPSPEARAKAFVHWVRRTADAEAAFVVDGYGAAIAEEPDTDSVFLASLSNLADALGRGREHFSRPNQNAVHLELEDQRVLCVVQAKWDVATVALGVIRSTPLPRDMAVRYRMELGKLAQKPRRRPRD